MPLRKRERGSGMWGASRTVDEAGGWWAGQCGRPVLWVGRGCGGSGPLSAGAVAAPRIGVGMDWHWGRKRVTGAGVGRHWGRKRVIGVGVDWHWGRKRVTGVGNGALGQVINLPQWVFSCPNAYSPTLVDPECLTGLWQDASARSRSPRRAWEGAAVKDKVTVGPVLTAIAPASPPAVLRQGDCRVCSHSDTASVTRPSEGPVPIGARFHSDTDTAGSVFTVVPLVSQWRPWFHSDTTPQVL